ncbi:MAG: hypothetical protein ACI9B2_000991, partial [Flavobacteriales bacterium]
SRFKGLAFKQYFIERLIIEIKTTPSTRLIKNTNGCFLTKP